MNRKLKNITVTLFALFVAESFSFSQPSVYKIEKMPFSKPFFNDIAPVMVKDGIIFCSDRRTSSSSNITTFEGDRIYNLYFAEKRDSLRWRDPYEIQTTGSTLLYYGPLSISSDGSTVYFTSSVITGKAARKRNIRNTLGIFIGDLSGKIISNIKPFEYNSTQYNIAHPSISRDGRYLFFASDMPGGQGGSDIYFCELANNRWSEPKNLGNKVNSPSKENYPFIHPSGRLYFSSDRPGTATYMGGMDVYCTTLVYGEWDDPVPLPEPVNSSSDDFALTASDNLQEGYFARKTGRDDNIWKFTSNIIRKESCNPAQPNNYCYEFIEENAIKYDTLQVPFIFKWNFGDGETAEGVRVVHCYKNPGNYVVRLDIVNILTGEIEVNEKTYNLEVEKIQQAYISGPDRCFEGEKIVFDADSTYLPGWSINQYYWNFGDETIAMGTKVDKVYQRPGDYTIQLIITSAPDENGRVKETCVSKNITVGRKP
ncbi:MAG: PKD domain-containing protein [Bacteroidales bacterium]